MLTLKDGKETGTVLRSYTGLTALAPPLTDLAAAVHKKGEVVKSLNTRPFFRKCSVAFEYSAIRF